MKLLKLTFVVFIFNILCPVSVTSQIDTIIVHFTGSEKPLVEIINDLEKETDINFYYKKEWLDSIIIPSKFNNSNLKEVLDSVRNKNNLYFTVDEQNNIFISKKEIKLELRANNYEVTELNNEDNQNVVRANNSNGSSKLYEKITIGKNGASTAKFANIKGTIKEMKTGEPILGAYVFVEELKKGAVTDINGNYMLSIEKGTYTFTFRAIGEETSQKLVTVYSDGMLNVDLEESLIVLNEVVVQEYKYNNTRSMQIGIEKISMKEIKELPPMSGERDILKASLLLPGVQTVGESSAGYNIRGGAADQNLFLINNVPILNTSHMFGFFSAFNPDVIRNFNLYKSNIPIEYGGRVSSVFDIQTKNGNQKQFSLKGSISPITAKLSAEGPIIKNKSSYIIGVRSTYSDWILKTIDNPEIRNSNIHFYDAVVNINTSNNENNSVGVFGYYSQDNYRLPTGKTYNYYNVGSSVNWQHFFGKKLYSRLSLIYSNYHLQVLDRSIINNENIFTHDIKQYEINHQFNYNLNLNHAFKFGYSSKFYMIEPGTYVPETNQSTYNALNLEKESALESAIFFGDRFDINPKLGIEGGIRYSFYNTLGPKTVYNYQANERPSLETLVDTSYYGNLKTIKKYSGLDISLSLRYLLNNDNSIKIGYNRITQYLFMLTNTIAISPTDRWKLCDNYTPPIVGTQYNLGYYHNITNRNLETSAELYYKTMDNLKEFKNGSDPEKNEFLQYDLISGIGRAYGIELMVKKTHGKLNGWINYTYSKSELKFAGKTYEETINNGAFFPANAARPHTINLTTNVKSNRRLSWSMNFTYSTGRPSTFPKGKSEQGDWTVFYYENRNMSRIPDYLRIDLAINLEGNLKRKKAVHSFWTLSVYNLTGRRNAYSVYFTNENGVIKGHEISIFPNPIFALTWNLKLGNYLSE